MEKEREAASPVVADPVKGGEGDGLSHDKQQEEEKKLEVADGGALRRLEEELDLPILYADNHIVVVVKPPGLNTAPGHKLLTDVATDRTNPDGKSGTSTLEPCQTVSAEEGTTNDDGAAATADSSSRGGKKRSHQEMWEEAVQEVGKMSLPEDKRHLQQHVEKLGTLKAVPRKRRVFRTWSTRCLKLQDEAAIDDIFALCQETFERREGRRMDAVTTRLLRRFKEVKAVHRLDCETSGALVVALTVEAARDLSDQFHDKVVEKGYVALVSGGPFKETTGEVTLPMRADENDRPRQIIDHVGGKRCRTIYRVLDYDATTGNSRVALTPYTGRTHQLRVHMAALQHPMVGDSLYDSKETGSSSGSTAVAAGGVVQQPYTQGAVRLHLHAETLAFNHPITHERMSFVAPTPF